MIDPVTGAMLASTAVNALSGFFGGKAKTKQEELDRAQRTAEFNRTQGQSEGRDAVGYERQMGSSGMRDQIQHMLMARMGAPPQPFVPRVQGGQGGAAFARQSAQPMQAAAAGYTPGAGGVQTDVMQQVMQRMGYGAPPRQATPRPTPYPQGAY